MKPFLTLLFLAAVLTSESSAALQRVIVRGGVPTVRVPGFVFTPFGYYGWAPWAMRYGYGYPYGYGGVTPYGDARRGMADLVRARGYATEQYSKALLNQEEARSKYLENQQKWLQMYHERRRLGEERQEQRNKEIRESRERYLAYLRSQEPDRLSPSQLNPNSGKLDWPEALKASAYNTLRSDLEGLFTVRAKTGANSGLKREIFEKSREMLLLLKSRIEITPASDYIAARRFLDVMASESQEDVR